jgi:hypothetical protein
MGPDPDKDFYQILLDKSDQIPTRSRCRQFLRTHNVSDEHAFTTALAIDAKLRYNRGKHAWDGPGGPYAGIWSTFKAWVLRPPLSVNGASPGRQRHDEQTAVDPYIANLERGET